MLVHFSQRYFRLGRLVSLLAGWILSSAAFAATLSVDDDRLQDPHAAFTTIQSAINVSTAGDMIIVWPGTYREQVRIGGRTIRLQSMDPTDPAIVAATVIDARFLGSTVSFSGTETAECVLEGFTITQGLADYGGGISGGPLGTLSRATVRRNVITTNVANIEGGGVYGLRGIFELNTVTHNNADLGGGVSRLLGDTLNNVIENNTAREGAGLYRCSNRIERNAIRGNTALTRGGGMHACSGYILNNLIEQNVAEEGGGLASCSFIVKGNVIRENSAQRGGGLFSTSAEIENNQIEKNQATTGAGLYQCSVLVKANTITNNYASGNGGGLAECNGLVTENTFEGNATAGSGGGAYRCSGTVERNIFRGNQAARGGGVGEGTALVQYNSFFENQADLGGAGAQTAGRMRANLLLANRARNGGGLYDCGGIIENNTLAGNAASEANAGAGITLLRGAIVRNNILAGHAGCSVRDLAAASSARHALFQNNAVQPNGSALIDSTGLAFVSVTAADAALDWCERNLPGDPRFLAPTGMSGDYRLAANSPCLDRGALEVLDQLPVLDHDGLSRWAANGIDLGCYERGALADTDGDALSDAREAVLRTNPALADSDGDGLIDRLESLRGGDPLRAEGGGGLRVPADTPTLQRAILLAYARETITIERGRYREVLRTGGKTVRLVTPQPDDAQRRKATILDAGGAGPALSLNGTETAEATIEGLTIVQGNGVDGSAIQARGAPAALRFCEVTSCTASGEGTIHNLDGPIEDCLFAGNSAQSGAALNNCDGPIRRSQFLNNFARAEGGALWGCGSYVEQCVFTGNRSLASGGAIARQAGMIIDSRFESNRASTSGGAVFSCNATLAGNYFSANRANSGGAASGCRGLIEKNTFRNNFASFGGAFNSCNGTIRTNTIEANTGEVNGGAFHSCSSIVDENRIVNNQTLGGGGVMSLSAGFFRGNTVLNNSAGYDGGVFSVCEGLYERNVFSGNTAFVGGAFNRCSGTVRENEISGNTAAGSGGAFEASDCLVTLNLIRNNTAITTGGAFNRHVGAIVANRIQGNSAQKFGGGLALCSGIVSGNLIEANSAQDGAALFAQRGPLFGNTIARNHVLPGGHGGAIFDSTARIENNVLFENQAIGIVVAELPARPPRTLLNNCSFGHSEGDFAVLGSPALASLEMTNPAYAFASGNIHADPRFTSPNGVDGDPDTLEDNLYRPQRGSVLIDAGITPKFTQAEDGVTDGNWARDLENRLRPLDGNGDGMALFDIGAYEIEKPENQAAVRDWLNYP